MAYMIKPQETTYFPKRKAQKKASYLAWLHELPCCVTGRHGVEAAHLSFQKPMFGHYGRGKGTKASDRWALPLSSDEHRRQHSMSEQDYWEQLPWSPHILALTLWGLWSEMGDDATEFATAVIMERIYKHQASRSKRLSCVIRIGP